MTWERGSLMAMEESTTYLPFRLLAIFDTDVKIARPIFIRGGEDSS
jgi:hypothetical protein